MIKILTDNDASQFKQLMTEAYQNDPLTFLHEFNTPPEITNEEIHNLLNTENQNTNLVFGAFQDETLVGFLQLYHSQHITKKHKALIQSLYVTPQYRDESLAHQLIDAFIQYAKNHGIENIMVSVASNNITAKVFFDKIGFEFLGLEEKARKINNHYIEEHWLIYYTC